MLRPRIIPSLLVHNNGLVKTVKFKNHKYIGDPINTVKIFNEKQVDELVIFDIDATVKNNEPNYKMIESIAMECRMPLCYGGGIKSVEQASNIFSLGVEKIALSSEALINSQILHDIGDQVGLQSVVVVLDIKRNIFGKLEIFIKNGTTKMKINPFKYIHRLKDIGVGEIIINSINNDGTMLGYDFIMLDKIIKDVDMPLTILGGAGSMQDIANAFQKYGIIGASAGSLFVFKGKYKAVLVNYPSEQEKEEMYNSLNL